jgi:hypothetical protein
MNRRDWLTKTSLALAGGLVLGNEAMEVYERLSHRKVWAMGDWSDHTKYVDSFLLHGRELPMGHYRMSRQVILGRGGRAYGSTFEYTQRTPWLVDVTGGNCSMSTCTFVCPYPDDTTWTRSRFGIEGDGRTEFQVAMSAGDAEGTYSVREFSRAPLSLYDFPVLV